MTLARSATSLGSAAASIVTWADGLNARRNEPQHGSAQRFGARSSRRSATGVSGLPPRCTSVAALARRMHREEACLSGGGGVDFLAP